MEPPSPKIPRQPPPILYKYCDARGIDILENLRVRVSPPDRFNDPFEFAPIQRAAWARREVKRVLVQKDKIREIWADMSESGSFKGSFKDFKKTLRKRVPEMLDSFGQRLAKQSLEFKINLTRTISERFALLCLAEIKDDILMWSHYSHSHRGIVIGIQTSDISLESDPNLLKVEYSLQRADMDYLERQRSAEESRRQTDGLIRRKSLHWSYEREWRRLYFLSDCVVEGNASHAGSPEYFVPIKATTIREVIIGCRATVSTLSRMRHFQNDKRFEHVNFCNARIHDTEFTLTISPMP